ncbi:hypothetical protein CLV24_101278 [Pontibacter ummariensis]|uniref:Uncharacterized protein n=1 Tax=Pontibacter ummariensis TaxID=1610492 RepID=A0A239BBW7_9BACT|nr:hypothetical protein [Pontibacter ummariensis]PRY16432.1 hypothetical protein CLV24_101278 [Pontibacter ummariensis]SNS05051.1 hypothetical protein SAMN06296052_101278 [Pontibacter ummariensis]
MVLFRYLFTCLLSLILLRVLAQEPSQPVRLELPFDPEENDVEVLALPDSSLLVYHKTSNLWDTQATFYFTKYNHVLKEVWADSASLPPDSEYLRYFTEKPFTYLVFGKDDLQEYNVVRINLETGQTEFKEFEIETVDALYEFQVLQGNYFLITRSKDDGKLLLMHLNPTTGKVKLLPGIYGDKSYFSDLLADPAHDRIDAVLTESNGRVSRLQVKSFDRNGELLNNYFILQKDDKSLLNAEITRGDSLDKLLVGTYGTRDLRYNRGFFTAPLASRVVDAEFYNVLQLQNFLKYMKPRREARIRRREADRLKAGKEPRYHYRLLLHDLISTPNGYVLAAEAYYPQYRSGAATHRLLGRMGTIRNPEEGYKRTHAVALGFDKNGILLWDNTFPLKDVMSYELVHTLEVGRTRDGRVIMAYPDEDKIIYRIMDEEKFDDEETELEIQPYKESGKIVSTEYPGIIKWYDGTFVAFGFNRVRFSNLDTRNIFYLNKIHF